MDWYARQVAERPCCVLLLVAAAGVGCAIVCLCDLPDFKEPLAGFEARGTSLSDRSTAWHNLLRSTGWNGPLTLYPPPRDQRSPPPPPPPPQQQSTTSNATEDVEDYVDDDEEEEMSAGRMVFERPSHPSPDPPELAGETKNFFCNNPTRGYAHVILEPRRAATDLFSAEALRASCALDARVLRAQPSFPRLCEQRLGTGQCCRSWHLANYVALLRNLSSCARIRRRDAQAVRRLLRACAPYYHGMKLSHDCAREPALCRGVPRRCTSHDAVYAILHFLSDASFLRPSLRLARSALFLPVAQSSAALPYWTELTEAGAGVAMGNEIVVVAGAEFGLKFQLFSSLLVRDSAWVCASAAAVLALLWLYSRSLLVTACAAGCACAGAAAAYCAYTFLLRLRFFPFINLMAVVVVVGICADDVCLYCKLWRCAREEGAPDKGSAQLVRETLRHACASALVTSATTALAFFGSAVSDVTAVKCFSIFAGTAVLANLLFTVSWLPAAVVLADRWGAWPASRACAAAQPIIERLLVFCRERALPPTRCVVGGGVASAALVAMLGACAIAAAVLVLHRPGLRPPDTREFRVFRTEHPFDRYDLELKQHFWFERMRSPDDQSLPVRVVWGVAAVDRGSRLDPWDRAGAGLTEPDPTFDPASPAAQRWLAGFCSRMRNQSFVARGGVASQFGLANCFVDTFRSWMERRCSDGVSGRDRTPCCETSKFPFRRLVFERCVGEAVSVLHHTPGYFAPLQGVRFSKATGRVQALVVQYEGSVHRGSPAEEVRSFVEGVDAFLQEELDSAPTGLKGGWWTSDLELFDLQESLRRGALQGLGVGVAAVFVLLLLATRGEWFASLAALLGVAGATAVTLALLTTLFGWRLDVLESTAVCVAAGLAADPTLHYGVAWKLTPPGTEREIQVLARVGAPVAAGALTTILAGAFVLPSSLMAYSRIGTFLVLLTFVSWAYATFFFLPLLSLFRPCSCISWRKKEQKPMPAAPLSESSSSAASCPQPAESHELEPLTTPTKLKKKKRKEEEMSDQQQQT